MPASNAPPFRKPNRPTRRTPNAGTEASSTPRELARNIAAARKRVPPETSANRARRVLSVQSHLEKHRRDAAVRNSER
jgi:ribosomal protein S15P/S13E